MARASKQSHTPESVKHRHRPTSWSGITTSSSGKPGGLRWACRYTDPATGTQKMSPSFRTRQEALSYQAEIRGKVDRGTVIGNPSMTLRQLVEEYRVVRDSRVRRATAVAQENHLKLHILPVLGHRKVRDISRATVLQWQAGLRRKDGGEGALSAHTVNLIRTTLSSVLDHAVAANVVAVNVCKTLTRGERPKRVAKEKSILAPGDLEKLLASVGRRKWLADVLEVTLGQALRLGEVCALDWADVDFAGETLTVAHSISKTTNVRGLPKGGKAASIRLTPAARKVLLRGHMAAGRPQSGPVFASVDGVVEGGYRHPNSVTRAFAQTYARSGITTPGLSMHSLRHTAITLMANSPNVPLVAVQRFARHADIQTTMGYVHEIKNEKVDRAVDAVFEAMA